jgi:hypothetical protein
LWSIDEQMRFTESTRRRVLSREHGFALPTVLFMVLASFAIASAAVTAALGGQKGTVRDHDTKSALGVAEAGVDQTLERYNLASATPPCATGCTGSFADGGTYTTWTRLTPHACPSGPHDALEIVSEGTVDGISRRVYVKANSASNECPFLNAGIIGLNSIDLDSNASVTGDVATNGNVILDANAGLCGGVQVGEGYGVTGDGAATGWTCSSGTPLYGSTSLPAVNQGNVDVENQNSQLLANVGGKKPSDVCYDGRTADGIETTACGSRELVLNGNASLTLTTGNYSLCRLQLISNSAIYIASNAIVRIYFDSPEACLYQQDGAGTTQLELDSNTRITVNGGAAANVAMLFVGSEAIDTSIVLASNTLAQNGCNQDFVIYAPLTDVTLRSNSFYCGAIAGESIHVDSNSSIQSTNEASDFDIDAGGDHYYAEEFKECSGAAAAYTSAFENC